MKAIKTFLSLSVIFVFIYISVFFLFSLTSFFPKVLLVNEQMPFVDVFFYSFPLSVVISSLITIFVSCRSQSFSPLIFYFSVASIFVLGMVGIRFFVLDTLKNKEDLMARWKPYKVYSVNKDKFLMFSRSHGLLLENVIGIQTSLDLGASQLYSEATIESSHPNKKEINLFPSRTNQASQIFQSHKDTLKYTLNDDLGLPLQSFLRDIYYMSYHILQLPLEDFILNIAILVFFILSLGYFSESFTGFVSVLVIVWFTRSIFFLYRFLSFSIIEILKDANLLPNNIFNFLPLLFIFLISISLIGMRKLIFTRKY